MSPTARQGVDSESLDALKAKLCGSSCDFKKMAVLMESGGKVILKCHNCRIAVEKSTYEELLKD